MIEPDFITSWDKNHVIYDASEEDFKFPFSMIFRNERSTFRFPSRGACVYVYFVWLYTNNTYYIDCEYFTGGLYSEETDESAIVQNNIITFDAPLMSKYDEVSYTNFSNIIRRHFIESQ